MTSWRVALLYNSKANVPVGPDSPPDALFEYDSQETILALEKALTDAGHQVVRLEGDETFLDTIRQARPDICFNICEGIRGDSRESHVPAVLELLGIPYTASKVLTHAISLDKAITKRIWRDCGLPTAPFQVFARGDEALDPALCFPLFVKPVREGTGMGIDTSSIVRDEAALRDRVGWVIRTYRQPALVETFLTGREFTVGLIGNALAPGERPRSPLYDETGFHVFPPMEIDVSPVAEAGGLYTGHIKSHMPMSINYLCPAPIEDALAGELKRLAVAAFLAINGLDVGRVDFRLGDDGRPYLMEINTLPGMNPVISDMCMISRAEGIDYPTLVNEILNLAAARYGMV